MLVHSPSEFGHRGDENRYWRVGGNIITMPVAGGVKRRINWALAGPESTEYKVESTGVV